MLLGFKRQQRGEILFLLLFIPFQVISALVPRKCLQWKEIPVGRSNISKRIRENADEKVVAKEKRQVLLDVCFDS